MNEKMKDNIDFDFIMMLKFGVTIVLLIFYNFDICLVQNRAC